MKQRQSESERAPTRQAFLEPVEVTNKVEVVIQRIAEAILNGDLESGKQLPAERLFAESLGVSRAIVREAYSALQVTGVIERRTGMGSYITEVPNPDVLRSRVQSILHAGADPYEVWLAREAIEPGLASMCVKNATDRDMECIEEALRLIEQGTESENWNLYFEGDRSFHAAYAGATHNASVIAVMEKLGQEMKNPLMKAIKTSYFLSDTLNVESSERIHRKIYEALTARDASALYQAMREHFRSMGEVLGYETAED